MATAVSNAERSGADSVFGTTQFDSLIDAPAARVLGPAAPRLELCHAGVVLRALVLVQGTLAVAVAFAAGGWSDAFDAYTVASASAIPAVLLWLSVACLAGGLLARTTRLRMLGGLVVLGAASGAFGWQLSALVGVHAGAPSGPWPAALAGAWLALLMTLWLQSRSQMRQPAETAARLAELQARIRPHFLFNTLNSALSLVQHDPARAETLLEDLAELFRVALSERGESTSLADELELARRYLEIEQIRFGDRLRLIWEVDPDAGGARLPPLLLQPLVENAVQHGVEPSADGGTIRIRTRVHRGSALVSIANTVPRTASRPGHGIALANVRERLSLLHDVAAQFQVRASGDVYRVQIRVPL